jgi:hypothetical protein
MSQRSSIMCAGVLLALLGGCDLEVRRSLPDAADAPYAVDDGLVYVGHDADDTPWATLVDLRPKNPKVERIELGAGDLTVSERPGQSATEVLVLSAGKAAELDDGKARDLVNAQLAVFDRGGKKRTYALAGRFTQLAVSADGRFAIAFAPPGGEFSAENALAVVDLTRSASDPKAATTLLLNAASGEMAESFVFSPPGAAHALALLRMQNRVMVIDLMHPTADQIDAPVALTTAGEDTRPQTILFSGDSIFVQSAGSASVLVLDLVADAGEARGFSVSPRSIPTGSAVFDIALDGEGEAQRLIVLAPDGVTAFTREGRPGDTLAIPSGFSRLMPFEGRSPFDDDVRRRLLLWGQGATLLGFLDVDDGSDAVVARDVDVIDLVEPVASLVTVADRKLVVAVHDTGRLSLVNLQERTVSPISAGDTPEVTLLDAERARLWVTTYAGRVGSIDLATLGGAEVLLEPDTVDLRLVPGPRPRVALIHDSSAGHVTLLDAAHPTRDGARELVGFLWSGLFD